MSPPAHDTQPPERRSAVALRYDSPDGAPRLIAKGYGNMADTIIRTAQAHDLYIHPQPELVALLQQVDLDAHIPPQLYAVIAQLLAWLYALETEPSTTHPPSASPKDDHAETADVDPAKSE